MIAKVSAATGERAAIKCPCGFSHRLELPEDSPFALFAIGRSVGWLAHNMEQVTTGAMIRPRARYAGPAL